jgi:hypothetical protein
MGGTLIQNFIDMDKWNAARWKAVTYLNHLEGTQPPCLGLAFENGEIAKQIFADWIKLLGRVDSYEELRITIIEEDIPNERPFYSVQVSSNPWHTEKRAKANGMSIDANTAIVVTRVNKMYPEPNSPHLATFKREFTKHGRYFLIPVSIIRTPQLSYDSHFEYSIGKTEIQFKRASEITAASDSEIIVDDYTEPDDTVH